MLVFPQWRPDMPGDGCRVPRWMPAERFAPYIARPVQIPPSPPQVEDEESSGSASPERELDVAAGRCGWRGCGARLPSVARLSAHVARAHALAHSDGLFYCGWTGCARPHRGFNARYKMLVHIRTHTNERPHTCHQCNKCFSRAENLKIHLRSHSGEKPYVCPYEGCGKAYSNSSDRFKHTRTHTVEKPYCCKVPGCNKRYTDPSSLRKHVKTFKHFVAKNDVQDHTDASPRDIPYTSNALGSPLRMEYSSPSDASPTTIPTYNPLSDSPVSLSYVPLIDPLHYTRTLDPVYPIRIPTHDIPFLEYKQSYESVYKGYYSNELTYPVLRPSVIEKAFTYEDHPRLEVYGLEKIEKRRSSEVFIMDEDMPLNLKCKTRQVELVRNTDLPLDLSTKS